MTSSSRERLITLVLNRGLLQSPSMRVVDVGVSGGLDPRWEVFGDTLWALGFDPLTSEIERLLRIETRPLVTYEAGFVGWKGYEAAFPAAERRSFSARDIRPYERSSTLRAHELTGTDYIRENFNAGAEVRYSERFVELDGYFRDARLPAPDFIKVDTDGSDFPVLLGAAGLIESGNVLGVTVEAQFHGAIHPFSNTFANMDEFLRERGFSLYDLRCYRYSRAALPQPFLMDVAAQTVAGQVTWGEALYFRDLGEPLYGKMFGYEITAERVLKLCCLFELYGLSDCAAELLLTPALSSLDDREALLDAVVPDALFGRMSYSEFMQRFDVDPHSFFPSRVPRAARFPDDDPPGIQELVQAADQRDALRAKIQERDSDLQRRKAEHRQRIIELKAQKARLRAYKIKVKDQRTRIHNYKQQVAALQKRVGK